MTGLDDNGEDVGAAGEVDPEPNSPPEFVPSLPPEQTTVGPEDSTPEAEDKPVAVILAEETEREAVEEWPEEAVPVAAVASQPPPAKRARTRAPARKAPSAPVAARGAAGAVQTASGPVRPTTLSIDVGGTGLKASVLDAAGKLVADRVRVVTPHPCPPDTLIESLATLVAPLPSFDRVSVGFPGVVRRGVVLTAPHLVIRSNASGAPAVQKLVTAWRGFDLAAGLSARFGRPVRVINDADLQGLDVVSGSGLEFVVTLGTGVGTALLLDGRVAPHLELAHHPFRRGETYDEQLGDAALRRIGARKWRKRFEEARGNFESLINYDKLYVGGGNSRLLVGHLDASITIVDNLAGILGGIKLWELPEH